MQIHTKLSVNTIWSSWEECDPYRVAFQDVEMLHEFPELKAMLTGKVACVAEGPGGFVQATSRGLHVDVMTR
jgi:hypothetical protein